MNDELPFQGPSSSDGSEAPYEWLDEWLCEYVDGTMDPSLETVFEQYVEANPELKSHVQRLRKTRELLCNCGLSTDMPDERGDDRESARDASSVNADGLQAGDRPYLDRFGVVSAVTVALLLGFLAGVAFTRLGAVPSASQSSSSEVGISGRESATQQAGPATGREPIPGGTLRLQPVDLDSSRRSIRGPGAADLP